MKAKPALKLVSDLYATTHQRSSSGGGLGASVLSCCAYFLCALILFFPFSATAQNDQNKEASHATHNTINGTLDLSSSLGKTIHLPAPAASIFIADPTIADFQAPSNKTIFVFGKKSGRTSLFALDDNGEVLAELRVVVTESIEDLRAMLRARVGDYPIHVRYTPRGAILSGTAPNAQVVETATKVTEQFLGDGAQVVNEIEVSGSLQVNLSVRVAEVSRSAMKELGINLTAVGTIGNLTVGFSSGKDSGAASGGGTAGVAYNDWNTNLGAVLDALAREHVASVLAEPNLTAMSGESANFLAGGEFPIPIARDNGQVSIEFRHFGVGLEFLPIVLNNDQINIRVKSEASELSKQGAVQISGISVPAISTRRAETVVELGSGQSFAIGGLIRRNVSADIRAFPWLGEVPILGALFRSSSFQKEETELVIIVTPYIVRPGTNSKQMSAPTDRLGPPLGPRATPTNSPQDATRRDGGSGALGGFIIE
ncbi:type II and III secretion system protein family protein [Rhizobium etli]|uniref:type II and III secretion system protein family protein n=1 Tax=Rhizobium etli TaxID=29449 RepID=UPI0009B7DA45|nr:type II and III secretion system protein family protein [Rhizobium etli]